ncbi:MAG: hypothetical protein DMF53_18390 [Acidobacteria bacterium]|nr:MAG: hypothetical protein DMF53_18390 [Acidobacteriota bacterium]
MSLTMLDLGSDARTYSSEPLPPLRPIWVGFVLALGFLVGEVITVSDGNVGVAGLFLLGCGIGGALYWLACVQRFHTILNLIAPFVNGKSTYPYTSGQAVGYHFIPFYNLIWVYKWPAVLSRYLEENTPVRMMSGGALGLLSLLALLMRAVDGFMGLSCLFLLGVYISGKLQQAMNEHERVRGVAEVFT